MADWTDGAYLTAGLAYDQNGNLYSTTEYGAEEAPGCGPQFGCGSVFDLSPPSGLDPEWTETLLHGFTGPPMDCHTGCGTVFQMTPPISPGGPWTETILHSFSHGADGAYPAAGLVLGKKGVLYGAAAEGGPNNSGTIFEIQP